MKETMLFEDYLRPQSQRFFCNDDSQRKHTQFHFNNNNNNYYFISYFIIIEGTGIY